MRTSCMRVQRNSNRDTTVGPAANYTYGSYYASERRKFSIGNLTDVCIQRFRFNRITCYNKMFELYLYLYISQFESVIGVRDSRTKSSLPISEKFLVLGK